MRNKLHFTLLAMILNCVTLAQTNISIEGFGSVNLPEKMEVQGGAYKTITDKNKAINGISASKVIFQQKGLNSGDSESLNTYARVFFRTEKGTTGDYSKLDVKPTQDEATEINSTFKTDMYSEATNSGFTIETWSDAKVTTINGNNAIMYSYSRKSTANKTTTFIETYFVQNNDRLHIITFEYRNDDYGWSSIFSTLKSSLKITKY